MISFRKHQSISDQAHSRVRTP